MSSERIIEAAKALTLKSAKLPSIRAIAKQLDVDPMAIYHYFGSKQMLLEGMATSIVSSVYEPKRRNSWERELAKLAVSYVSVLREYPGLLEAMLASPVVGPVFAFSHRFEAAVHGLDLDETAKADALHLFIDYLHGFAYAATCGGALSDELETEEVVRPLYLLFRGIQTQSTTVASTEMNDHVRQ